VICVSISERSTVRVLLGAVVLLCAGCDAMDGHFTERTDPRLLAEGDRWAVVAVKDDYGDCLELRSAGVTVARTCEPRSILYRFEIAAPALRGGAGRIAFGLLPPATAKADIAVGGTIKPRPGEKLTLFPLAVREFGESRRFVAEPLPAGAPRDDDSLSVELLDAGGQRIAP
jgi:hypothetical protein